MSSTSELCKAIRNRTQEHKRAIENLNSASVPAVLFSILRQELDSLIRVIFLLSIEDKDIRDQLVSDCLHGKKWKLTRANGKQTIVTDKEMVDLSNSLHHWTRDVYVFGCSFIHLSNYHNYLAVDPVDCLTEEERISIAEHLNYYHSASFSDGFSLEDLIMYIPRVFEKVASNLDCYLKDLEKGGSLEDWDK